MQKDTNSSKMTILVHCSKNKIRILWHIYPDGDVVYCYMVYKKYISHIKNPYKIIGKNV